jgi:hypothetical protein
MDEEFEKWLTTRPQMIQEMGRKYPPGQYVIAEGAPYGFTCPGTIVNILAYCEDGSIDVVVEPEQVRPEAIEHNNRILHPQGRDQSEFAGKAISAHVDPKYLVPFNSKADE